VRAGRCVARASVDIPSRARASLPIDHRERLTDFLLWMPLCVQGKYSLEVRSDGLAIDFDPRFTDPNFDINFKRTNCTSALMRRLKRSTSISESRECVCATFPIFYRKSLCFFDAGTRGVTVQYAVTDTRHPRFLDTIYF
jgi:hypothetical protein